MRALDDMVRSGKVRYVGCCNFSAWQLVEAAWTSKAEHLVPLVSAQNRYNMLERDIEKELIPAAQKYGLGILPFYPLAAGLLTGKYTRDYTPEGTRLTSGIHFYEGVLANADYDLLDNLTEYARERGHSLLELAIGWLASNPAVSCVMTGATKVEQIEANALASDWRLTPQEMTEVNGILDAA